MAVRAHHYYPIKAVQALPKQISDQTIAKLEAEIRQNQGRIERLQHRNARLMQRLEQIGTQSARQPSTTRVAPTATRKRRSRPLQSDRRKLSRQWLSIYLILMCMIICCGIIGFAVARLIAVR